MTLLELFESIFQYICRLNRSARKGGGIYNQSQVRNEINAILSDIRALASSDPHLNMQFEKIELPVIFFADSLIKNSRLSFALEWQDIAHDRNELAGEDRFFELLDETLADKSPAATERLAIFYTCMGLGFTGWYTGQPVDLRRKMLEMAARLRGTVDANLQTHICPAAYENVNTVDLTQPATMRLAGIAVALVGMIVVLFVTNVYLYQKSAKKLTDSLQKLSSSDATTQPDGAPDPFAGMHAPGESASDARPVPSELLR